MKKHWIAILLALVNLSFAVACKKKSTDGWEEYKYTDAGFAISAPLIPIPMRPSAEQPNARAYGIKYYNHSAVIITVGPLDMWENLSDKEKLPRMMDLTAQGTSSKLVSQKEISLDGNPGIEFEIEGSAEHWRSRF